MKLTTKLWRTLRAALGNDWRSKVRRKDFRCADFSGADFGGADFSYADFSGVYFGDADFGGADFRCADFGGADFRGADFSYADFSDADFSDAYFRGADFRGADFRGADFSGAHFSDADFGGADFGGAYFSENLKVIRLIMLANACVYPLTITIPIVEEAAKKMDEWKQGKPPIERGSACESGWAKAFGSEDYVITDNETHAFWYFCWRAAQ